MKKKKKKVGSIDLSGAISVGSSYEKDARPFSIDIVTPDRIWVLAAENEKEMDRWVKTMSKAGETNVNSFDSLREGYLMKKGKKK